MTKVKVKICCIKTIDEANMALENGADAIGLVGEMPSGPGVIKDKTIRHIVNKIGGRVDTFLLTSKVVAADIVAHHKRTRTSTIQLVDHVAIEELKKIKLLIPTIKLIKVIHVIDEKSRYESESIAPYVDGILLDSGNPNLKVKELGGTGRTHNWILSSQIVKDVNLPVYLAGGLNASNVREAIETVQPFGVDLCSGLRTNDFLDKEKIKSFMWSIYSTFK